MAVVSLTVQQHADVGNMIMYRPIFKSNPSITASVKVFLGFDKAVSLLRFKPRPRHRARSALPDPIQFIKPAGP